MLSTYFRKYRSLTQCVGVFKSPSMADPRPVESSSGAKPVAALNISDSIDICHNKVPKVILLQIFQHFDRQTLRAASEVSKSFNELSKHPSLWNNAVYSG